jgi:mitochondrial splicing suppressor protein 51
MRVFILGARSESSLPTHVWEQLTMLFPAAQLHLHFIGPQVSLPKPPSSAPESKPGDKSQTSRQTTEEQNNQPHPSEEPAAVAAAAAEAAAKANDPAASSSSAGKPAGEAKSTYLPNVYEPPTPAPIAKQKWTRSSIETFGVPSYTTPYTPALTVSGLRATYMEVHEQFAETYDPYTDVFFLFSPGFGFPSPSTPPGEEPLLQIASPTEWGPVLPNLLASKCAIFVTGFSPADVERDVRALASAPGVAGEFDWLITPGPNAFASEKWEVADFDPRVMVKSNWGVWGIRGKRREVRERSSFGSLF